MFLSRPVTRLPRILLLLETLVKYTPADHPDVDELPTLIHVLAQAVKGSQVSYDVIDFCFRSSSARNRISRSQDQALECRRTTPVQERRNRRTGYGGIKAIFGLFRIRFPEGTKRDYLAWMVSPGLDLG